MWYKKCSSSGNERRLTVYVALELETGRPARWRVPYAYGGRGQTEPARFRHVPARFPPETCFLWLLTLPLTRCVCRSDRASESPANNPSRRRHRQAGQSERRFVSTFIAGHRAIVVTRSLSSNTRTRSIVNLATENCTARVRQGRMHAVPATFDRRRSAGGRVARTAAHATTTPGRQAATPPPHAEHMPRHCLLGTPRQGGREGEPGGACLEAGAASQPHPPRAQRQAGGPRAGTSAASDLHCIGGHAGFGGGLRRRVGHPTSSAPACLPAVPSEPSPSKWLVFGWTYCHGSVTAARLRILPVTAACVRSGFQAQSRRAPAYVASSFLVVSLPGLSSHLFPRQR